MGDPREDAARERAEEREMDHECEHHGLSHAALLPKDWKQKREKRLADEEDERLKKGKT